MVSMADHPPGRRTPETDTCVTCGRCVPSYDGVARSDGKGGSLGFTCGRCWSALISERAGEDLRHLEIAPVIMLDAAGQDHEFHFRFFPAPRGLEAFELIDGAPGGYMFEVIPEDDEPRLVEMLFTRMRRALARQHLAPSDFGGQRIKDNNVRGRIEWNEEEDGRVPLMVIDGQPVTWDRFGEMLMSFEGCQFRMEMLDRSEEA